MFPPFSCKPPYSAALDQCSNCAATYGAKELNGKGLCPACRSIGPFPQEPAPGSPEAVKQAAETIRRLQVVWQTQDRPATWHYRLLAGGRWQRAFGGDRPDREWRDFDSEDQGTPTCDLYRGIEDHIRQRDALADALEAACTELLALRPYGKERTNEVLIAADVALRLAGRAGRLKP